MKIGKPAWMVVSTTSAGTLGCAWRHEWYNCIVLGTVAVAFAIVSTIAWRRGRAS